jgi:protein tyrosine phosphatase type IVA
MLSGTPDNSNIRSFINCISNEGIKHVVRLCGATYDHTLFNDYNINFYDWHYQDGSNPTPELVTKWTTLIKLNEPVLVHCHDGLGRSPLLATIYLIERQMDQYDAIEYIRKERPDYLNTKQLKWLRTYKPVKTSLFKKNFG